jgi:hypothetical protein
MCVCKKEKERERERAKITWTNFVLFFSLFSFGYSSLWEGTIGASREQVSVV